MNTEGIRDAEIVTTPSPITQPNPVETPTTPSSTKAYLKYIGAFLLGVALVGVGYMLYERLYGNVVAIVNGTRITLASYEENVSMMMTSAELQGIDVSDPVVADEIEKQALENLINNELLIGAARNAGMGADVAAVQSAYDALVDEVGGEEELKSRMETVGLTSDVLKSNISDRLIVDQYIEAETDIETLTVAEDEINVYVTSLTEGGITLPPLEEIKPQIEATLLAEKQQQVVDELITRLRSEADITIRIAE